MKDESDLASIQNSIVDLVHNSTLIFTPENISATNDTKTDPGKESSGNEPYLYLLFIDLIIFCLLTYSTYNSTKKKINEIDNTNGFRLNFLKWLVLANGMRALSLLFIIVFDNPNGNNGISWLNSILHVGPAFMFVSTYMYYAVFLADLYYISISYNNLLFKPILYVLVNGGYLLLLIIGVITLFISKYHLFFTISELLMALLYLVLGSIILYFGRKVSFLLDNKTQNLSSNETDNKIQIISYSLGALFVLKGISGVFGGFGIVDSYNHNIYDFFWFLILEILPTLIFMFYARVDETKANNLNNTSVDYQRNSLNESDFDNSMRFSQERNSSFYNPPFEKEYK